MTKTYQSTAGSRLRQEYETQRALFEAQPALVQRQLEGQASQLAEALLQRLPQVHFTLPASVVTTDQTLAIPAEAREHTAGNLLDRFSPVDTTRMLRQCLTGLEQSPDRAVALAAGLLRYVIARYMVSKMLPAGRSVTYVVTEGEEIPTVPVAEKDQPQSAITQAADAISENGAREAGRGELQVPYVPYARRFYLPQWVAFDAEDQLLGSAFSEAEAHLASMQRFVTILHTAVGLAAYFVADAEYQQKRYGILGQLVNQGRALARYQTREIIATIKRRAAAQSLNRGLSLDLPYFDDQSLQLKDYPVEVIPAGRVMFVPAFVVRAAREEAAKVIQDTRLGFSTRKHILTEFVMLEKAFLNHGA